MAPAARLKRERSAIDAAQTGPRRSPPHPLGRGAVSRREGLEPESVPARPFAFASVAYPTRTWRARGGLPASRVRRSPDFPAGRNARLRVLGRPRARLVARPRRAARVVGAAPPAGHLDPTGGGSAPKPRDTARYRHASERARDRPAHASSAGAHGLPSNDRSPTLDRRDLQPERSELRRGIAADFTRSRRGSYALSPDRSRVTRARPAASTLAVLIRGSATSGGSRQVDRAVVNRADGGGDRVVERERRA